ncbi:hypothetical protein HOD75_04080 [archaeon]|jgi:hypothetical protein|nr:hypothetical protein [Candidatus Woesearchaeota archaeon]MBT4135685.1 hypothetical protein [archaeon]MBT4242046.1 hypothetical protein [archaeon]MBT4417734.1 hypothetical protein [archaeon]
MVIGEIANYFQSMVDSIPAEYKTLVTLSVYTIFIVIYALFIYKFYKFLANKEIIVLNLKQYNYSNFPVLEKFFAVSLYTLEYLIILPFLVLFWFTVLSLFLLLLSKQDAYQILLISAAIIASTRITAYISEDLSKDIAKILPFTVLAMFVLGEDFFNLDSLVGKIIEIPGLFSNIILFVIFIFAIEFILRGISSGSEFFTSSRELSEASKEK